VLGVRDVLDEPVALAEEWARKNAVAAIEAHYHEIWIYGLPQICRPLDGLPLSAAARARARYVGYLRREAPPPAAADRPAPTEDYVLVTTGGGGDGAELVDWVLAAYESDPGIPLDAVIVYGPFMSAELRHDFDRRADRLGGRIVTLAFDSRMERLLQDARGVVAMGGYNTFCEILSLDKPAVIAPRTSPRLEQLIRTEAAERLGLLRMLHKPRDGAGPQGMAAAVRGVGAPPPPPAAGWPGLLGGLDAIVARALGTDLRRARHAHVG